MPTLETYKKQAKLLLRWHRQRNHSIGGRIRQLARYRTLTDREALALDFRLAEAQEIIALEAGYSSWAELKAAVASTPSLPVEREAPALRLASARPVLYVRDVSAAAAFYHERLGFGIDFLHGHPAFYGSVTRQGATLHLRFVHEPAFAEGIVDREELIMAFIEVENVKALYAEYQAAGVDVGKLTKEAWGGTDFIVRDPDGNAVCFVG